MLYNILYHDLYLFIFCVSIFVFRLITRHFASLLAESIFVSSQNFYEMKVVASSSVSIDYDETIWESIR